MFKQYLLIFITSIALIGSTTGCSLFKSDSEENADETVAEETTGDSDSETTTDESATEEVADSGEEEVVDEYPDDDYGGDTSVADATESTTTTTTTTTTDTAATDTSVADTTTETAIPDAPLDNGTTEESLFVAGDTPAEESTTTYTETSTVRDSYAATTANVKVKKMKATPYMVGGTLINRLYIVREGDTMKSISTKIYGDESRAKDLKSWNTTLKNTPKVGEKVYYASARNPADNSQIITYYEEMGIQPSYYTAKKGESIRKVSKQLLGHERSWMEVYATNEGDYYWTLPEGTSLRYWPAGAAASEVPVTQAAAEEVAPPAEEAPVGDIPPDAAPTDLAASDIAPPAQDDMGATPADGSLADDSANMAGTAGMDEPPPPPDDTMNASAPPPPPSAAAITPPEPPAGTAGGLAGLMEGQEDSMMVLVLGGLLVLASIILLIFIRRGRKKVKYT